MGVQVKNNAFSTLSVAISSVDTTMTVATGHGNLRFPSASPSASPSATYFYVTLINSTGVTEIVKVTTRTDDTFIIERSQDGTTATAFGINSRVELRPVAALFNELPNRPLITADYTDLSVTNGKLDNIGGGAVGPIGGLGKFLTASVNSKGRVTALTETNGIVQTNTFAFTTSGATQTWTKPTSAGSLVRIQCWGGGGGGGCASAGAGGGGGGGGAYSDRWMSLSDVTSTVSVVVGGGGAGTNTANTAGTAGENTTFGAYVTAYAGGGGGSNNSGVAGGGGGGGGGTSAGATGATSVGTGAQGGNVGGGAGGNGEAAGGHASAYEAGGGGSGGSATTVALAGGDSVWGGAGGGGANGDNNSGGSGGTSIYGGAGGAGRGGTGTPVAGGTPGGGGGGSEFGAPISGAGGPGRVIVTVYV